MKTCLDEVGGVGGRPRGRRGCGADGLWCPVGVEEGDVAVRHVAVQGVGGLHPLLLMLLLLLLAR